MLGKPCCFAHSRACLYLGLSRRRTRARTESGMPDLKNRVHLGSRERLSMRLAKHLVEFTSQGVAFVGVVMVPIEQHAVID